MNRSRSDLLSTSSQTLVEQSCHKAEAKRSPFLPGALDQCAAPSPDQTLGSAPPTQYSGGTITSFPIPPFSHHRQTAAPILAINEPKRLLPVLAAALSPSLEPRHPEECRQRIDWTKDPSWLHHRCRYKLQQLVSPPIPGTDCGVFYLARKQKRYLDCRFFLRNKN